MPLPAPFPQLASHRCHWVGQSRGWLLQDDSPARAPGLSPLCCTYSKYTFSQTSTQAWCVAVKIAHSQAVLDEAELPSPDNVQAQVALCKQ